MSIFTQQKGVEGYVPKDEAGWTIFPPDIKTDSINVNEDQQHYFGSEFIL